MLFVQIIAAIFGVVATVALTLWDKILKWADNSLFPWIEQNLSPNIADSVRGAFAFIDRIAVPIRRAVKQAWENLRQFLLKMVVDFQQKSSSNWIKRVTSYIIRVLSPKKSDKPEVVRVVSEEHIDPDFLPPDVREAWLRKAQKNYEVDATDTRDKEIAQLSMAN